MDNRNIQIVWLDNEQETFENVAGVEVDAEKVSLFHRGQHPTPFFVAPLANIRYYTINPGTGPEGTLPTPIPTGPITEYTSPESVWSVPCEHTLTGGPGGGTVRCTQDSGHTHAHRAWNVDGDIIEWHAGGTQ
jgi:hypothetical protein